MAAVPAKASLIESWENTLDGWAVPPTYNAEAFTPSFSTTSGVTNGSYSLAITGTGSSGPNYGQLLTSTATATNTSLLSTASAINLDVYTPGGSFGYYLQFQFALNGGGLGYQTLGSGYTATNIGSETTISAPITPAEDATLAASAAGGGTTSIVVLVGGGYSAGNETMYVDNLSTTPAPEPTSLAILGLSGLILQRRSRRV